MFNKVSDWMSEFYIMECVTWDLYCFYGLKWCEQLILVRYIGFSQAMTSRYNLSWYQRYLIYVEQGDIFKVM